MSWNPKSGVGMFEPGCIHCAYCGWKPDDPWDTSPDGFAYDDVNKEWACTECIEQNLKDETEAGEARS